MTPRSLGTVAFRILAIYVLVQVLGAVPGVIALLGKLDQLDLVGSKLEFILSGVVPSIVLLICGLWLLFRSEQLSQRVFPEDGDLQPIDRRDVQATAFAVAGIWVFGCSIPGLTACAGSLFSVFARMEAGHADFPWSSALGYGMQAAFGILLFLNAGLLARWWSRRQSERPGAESARDA